MTCITNADIRVFASVPLASILLLVLRVNYNIFLVLPNIVVIMYVFYFIFYSVLFFILFIHFFFLCEFAIVGSRQCSQVVACWVLVH